MVYDFNNEPRTTAKLLPKEKCDHCKQEFDSASKKFIHQRDAHGDLEGWLDEED